MTQEISVQSPAQAAEARLTVAGHVTRGVWADGGVGTVGKIVSTVTFAAIFDRGNGESIHVAVGDAELASHGVRGIAGSSQSSTGGTLRNTLGYTGPSGRQNGRHPF